MQRIRKKSNGREKGERRGHLQGVGSAYIKVQAREGCEMSRTRWKGRRRRRKTKKRRQEEWGRGTGK